MYEQFGRRSAYYKKVAGIRERQVSGKLTKDDEWFCAKESERVRIGFSLLTWAWLENNV